MTDRYATEITVGQADLRDLIRRAICEAWDVAHEEAGRLEEVAGIEAARGARCVAYRLRRMAAEEQPAAEARTPRVGEKWRSKHVDRVVTVNRVWEHEIEPGRTGVAYEWRDGNRPGLLGSACPLDVFHDLYEPATEARQDRAGS